MPKSLNILVANGVNLDLLGKREPEHYGKFDLKKLEKELTNFSGKLAKIFQIDQIVLEFFQTNDEGELLKKLSVPGYDGVLINPAAWTHTSVALGDRVLALGVPFVEVHISNVSAREEFRKVSYTAKHASGVVYGFGKSSYQTGLFGLVDHLLGSPSL